MSGEPKFLTGKAPYLIIGLIGLIVYFQSLFFGLTYLDDNLLITQNAYWLRDFSNFWQAFGQDPFRIMPITATRYFFYRPLMTVSFILDAQWGGMSLFSFHLTNLVLHLCTAMLIFAFFLKLKYKQALSFIGALIFVVHPAISAAVVWIPGRNDSLLAIFALLSLICFIDYVKQNELKHGLLNVAFFFLALLTKETALILVIFFTYYLCFMAEKRLSVKKYGFLAGGWGIAAVTWFLLRQNALSQKLSHGLLDSISTLTVKWPVFIQYLGKMIFPFNLSVTPTIMDTTMLYGYLAVGLMVLLLIFTKSRRYNYIVFGLLWFLLFILPTYLHSYPFQLEHRLYLPLIGMIILLLETDLIKRAELQGWKGFGIGLVIWLFILINLIHAREYRDPLTFWRSAVRSSPNSAMAHLDLSVIYYNNQMYEEQEKELNEALRLNPAESYLHQNLGLFYLNKKMWSKAENEFLLELQKDPGNDLTYSNLGVLYANVGKLELAKICWEKAIAANPENMDAYLKLAGYYYQVKDYKRSNYYVKLLDKKGIRVKKIMVVP